MFHKIKNKIIRELIKISSDPRPSSEPFISGDGFRKMADFIYDETQNFNPKHVKEGNIVFVRSDMLKEFFKEIHPKIKDKYKLISHNSDENITEEYSKYIDDKIIHWFAQNLMFKHPKVSVIPIGLENKYYYINGIPSMFTNLINKSTNKKNKILFGFSVSTNTEVRSKSLLELRENKNAEEILESLDGRKYLNLLRQYKYVASPPGNGVDCHRTWEAIILGTTPICLKNINYKLLKELGAPILINNSFKKGELKNKKITKISRTTDFDYWKKIVNNR